jgi:hypothetical protein
MNNYRQRTYGVKKNCMDKKDCLLAEIVESHLSLREFETLDLWGWTLKCVCGWVGG